MDAGHCTTVHTESFNTTVQDTKFSSNIIVSGERPGKKS